MNPDFKSITEKDISLFDTEWKKLYGSIGLLEKYDIVQNGEHRPQKKYYFGILVGGKMIGYLYFKVWGGRCYIDHFFIKEDFRRKGIGTKTFEWLEDFAKKKGCHKMLLKTTEKHLILDLAKRLGYKEEAVLRDDAFHLDWIYLSKRI